MTSGSLETIYCSPVRVLQQCMHTKHRRVRQQIFHLATVARVHNIGLPHHTQKTHDFARNMLRPLSYTVVMREALAYVDLHLFQHVVGRRRQPHAAELIAK